VDVAVFDLSRLREHLFEDAHNLESNNGSSQ
jgi:hypothetical protein